MTPPAPGRLPTHLGWYVHALWPQPLRLARLQATGPMGEAPPARPTLWRDPVASVLSLPADMQQPGLLRAAVAHAAAHVEHGVPPLPRGTLKPIQLALLGVLEDARVETLALNRLPGLRSLWLPWHVADARHGNSFDALLRRLQRVLLDPHHTDPHPWVRKAAGLFQTAPDAQALRHVASLLGHDIGQMRLPFNPQLYVVEPAYRDDNHHLWRPDEAQPEPVRPLQAWSDDVPPPPRPHQRDPEDAAPPQGVRPVARYPEWDRLIGRLRLDWCAVFEEHPVADATRAAGLGGAMSLPAWLGPAALATLAAQARRLQALLPADRDRLRERSTEGPMLHTAALVQAAADLRQRRMPDLRIYLRAPRSRQPMTVVVLIDASASTARPVAERAGGSLLQRLCEAAVLAAWALEGAGHTCAVQAFASHTRHAVRIQPVKDFDQPITDPATLARLAALRSTWSTRLGAALRHATAQLRTRPRPLVLLLTDGEPHDVDVYDSRYLPADLQHARYEAQRAGVAVACLDLAPTANAGPDALVPRLAAALTRP